MTFKVSTTTSQAKRNSTCHETLELAFIKGGEEDVLARKKTYWTDVPRKALFIDKPQGANQGDLPVATLRKEIILRTATRLGTDPPTKKEETNSDHFGGGVA